MLPPEWDASPSQGYPQHYAGTHLYTWAERSTVRVKCLAQEHNTMSPARPRTRTTRSGVEHTNHEATAHVGYELAIASLISNKREWNNCFIKFLKLQNFGSTKYERRKRENPSEIEKNLIKMRCCGIPCGQTDVGSSQKHFLPFRVLLDV